MRQAFVSDLKEGDVLARPIFSSNGNILLGKDIVLTPTYIKRLEVLGITNLSSANITRKAYFMRLNCYIHYPYSSRGKLTDSKIYSSSVITSLRSISFASAHRRSRL